MKKSLAEKYTEAADKFRILESKEERVLLYLSISRFLVFTVGAVIFAFIFSVSSLYTYFFILAVIILFLFLLKKYSEHTWKKEFYGNLSGINNNEVKAINGDYSHFEPGTSYLDPGHDFSFDIDIFGNYSVFQYINRTVTAYGRDILAVWLSDPYKHATEMLPRQESVNELAGKEDFRHSFMASGMKTPLEIKEVAGIMEWLRESSSIRSLRATKLLISILSGSAILSLILVLTGFLQYQVFVLIFLVNLFWIASGIKKTNMIHSVLSKRYVWLSSLNKLLKVVENESFSSAILNDIKLNVSGNNVSASVAVRKLSRLIQSFDSRLNMITGFVLNGLFLWDYLCILRLEKWKSDYRSHFPDWLSMIGKIDAFVSLGNFAYNNPDFIFPTVSDKKIIFEAKDLGHPLIKKETRVCNDYTHRHSGSIIIITGANMAGKSTFLRTVAVNYILAMIGAPVCASGLTFTPMKLFTSMRTADSLAENESYFYAELKRLKTLKDKIENNENIFFILDEILKGTNSKDKSLGSKLFLESILRLNATGIIATHDLSISELEVNFPESVFNLCFEIDINGDAISFDYKLYNGITQKMNAAILMKQMGILD